MTNTDKLVDGGLYWVDDEGYPTPAEYCADLNKFFVYKTYRCIDVSLFWDWDQKPETDKNGKIIVDHKGVG